MTATFLALRTAGARWQQQGVRISLSGRMARGRHPPHNGTSFDSVSDPRGRTDKLDEILLQGVAAIGNV